MNRNSISKILLAIFVSAMLSACAMTVPIKQTSRILEMKASETVLVVLEDYNGKGNIIPKGIYYPTNEISNGYLEYSSGKPLRVKEGVFALYAEDVCVGGIGVNFKKPYSDYALFVDNCNGEPALRINIPKTLKFKIMPKNEVSS
jgi:hypothetical protein